MLLSFLLPLHLLAAPATAAEQIFPRLQQLAFPAPVAGACGLKRFSVADYEIRRNDGPDEKSRISVMGAVIETTAPSCIRDYAVVQYIRGCVYHVRYDRATRTERERTFDVARRLRGPRVVFSHPGYDVDSTDTDPAYASGGGSEDRLGLSYVPAFPLRLRSDRASLLADLKAFNEPTQRSFLEDEEKDPSLVFVTDVPEGGVAFPSQDETSIIAINTSLDFRTCVYRTADVPTTGDPAPEGAAAGGPLACFGWMSRYTYDIASGDYVNDRFVSVDPHCAQAPARVPLPE